jgi:hypothetical protein
MGNGTLNFSRWPLVVYRGVGTLAARVEICRGIARKEDEGAIERWAMYGKA